MATAGLDRITLWGDLEGSELEDRWLLGRLVRPEGRTAWFEAIGPDGVPVMLSITEALNDEDELLMRLRAASEIRHRNVVTIRDAVISHLEDTPVVVAAMEMTEENLGDALRERLLSGAEGRQVFDAVLAALTVIHARGMVHRHVEASNVLAMNDVIKLRSDCLSKLSGSAFTIAAADDVRWTARMVTHAVTGRFPSGENDPVLQLLPETMARAVRRALSGIAGAPEVAALAGTRLELMPEITREATRIEPFSKAMKVAAVSETVVPMERKMADAGPARTERPAGVPATRGSLAEAIQPVPRVVALRPADVHAEAWVLPDPIMLPNEREPRDAGRMKKEGVTEESRWPSAPYVIAAAVAVVLVTVFTLYGLLHSGKTDQPVAARKTAAPAMAAARPVEPVVKTVVVNPAPATGPGWRVVAYTYFYEKEAKEKAAALAQEFPQLEPQVYEVRKADAWLVTVGGVMDKFGALAMREKAVRAGLPHDTYAQNFR